MRYLPCILLMVLATAVVAIEPSEMFEDPAQEARAREIGQQLRCLVCRNQSIFDSNAGLAYDMRVAVRERMTAGDSDAEVLDYLKDRFGDYVLLNPPLSWYTIVLWFSPVVLLLIGGFVVVGYMRGRPRSELDDKSEFIS
ncbi:MAG: cytochrome c-type biogenesis protein CcmH [Aestuariivita sp.]|nr:cytochrome c-type biogenesis protein CcmH [Aestuariivita sp.]MCY4346142.1 cytochrome c-type biogenesis protein CcmH [Aestuariivita sp.]